MMLLDTKQRKRITQLMGMTDSVIDAEALTFLRAARKMLREVNMTWEDLLSHSTETASGSTSKPNHQWWEDAPPEPDYFVALHEIKARSDRLTEWERDFIESLLSRRWPSLSEKQEAIVSRLWARFNS
jgi:hypothetical protein